MNKGQQFWLDRWQTGQTQFHQMEVNDDVLAYWSELALKPGQRVLVPLCGKSLDMKWFFDLGFEVIGIELSEQAVLEFSKEQDITFRTELHGAHKKYLAPGIEIWVGDVFTMSHDLIEPVDAIYDRGALIALPDALRPDYAAIVLAWLKPTGCVFLKTMEYDQSVMEGPPFSVDAAEVATLYGSCQSITKRKELKRSSMSLDHLYDRGLRDATDVLWFIKK